MPLLRGNSRKNAAKAEKRRLHGKQAIDDSNGRVSHSPRQMEFRFNRIGALSTPT